MKNRSTTTSKLTMPAIEKMQQTDSAYPHRLLEVLKDKAPSTLYFQGNTDLLKQGGIGFCGSRKSSPKGIEAVRDCVEQAAHAGFNIVSGNAAGIDFEAHYHALAASGTTLLVLPEGINHFRIKRALAPVWDWERTLVISQFNPDDVWKSYRAMARNRVIIGLSKAMIVIEAGEKGGTMNAGTETLKRNTPLYVTEYQDMSVDARGNENLLRLGGKRLACNKFTGRANMKKIFDDIAKHSATSPRQSQMGLL